MQLFLPAFGVDHFGAPSQPSAGLLPFGQVTPSGVAT